MGAAAALPPGPEGGRLKRAITPATVALLVVVFAVVNVCVLVLRRSASSTSTSSCRPSSP